MAITEDLLLRIGAVDNASSTFGAAKDAVVGALEAIRGKSGETAVGIENVSSKVGLSNTAMLGLAVGGVAVVGTALMACVGKARELGDQLADMSKATGVSVESLSTLKFAAEQSGGTLEGLQTGMTRLSRNMGEALADPTGKAADKFNRLGVEITDANGKLRSADQVMLDVAAKLEGMKGSTESVVVATNLFGKSGANLLPMLTEGRDGIEAMQARARELGLEMSGDTATAADNLGDKWDELKSVGEGLALRIGSALIPALVVGVEKLILVADTAIDTGRILGEVGAIAFEPFRLGWATVGQAISSGVIGVVNFLGDTFVRGINTVTGQINRLGQYIGVTLPTFDWSPLTTGPATNFSAEWEASKGRVAGHWDEVKRLSSQMAGRLTADTNRVATATNDATTKTEELEDQTKSLADTARQKVAPDVAELRQQVTAAAASLDTFASRTVDTTEFLGDQQRAFVGVRETAVDYTEFMDSYDWSTHQGAFSRGLSTSLSEGLKSDTSSATIAQGLGKGLSDAINQLAQGNMSWRSAATSIGSAIGSAIGGPIGGIIGQGIAGAASLVGNLFGGDSRAESRRDAIGELKKSLEEGDLANFGAFNHLSRALGDAGSAKLTVEAFKEVLAPLLPEGTEENPAWNPNDTDIANLLLLLSSPERLALSQTRMESDAPGQGLSNEQLRALQERNHLRSIYLQWMRGLQVDTEGARAGQLTPEILNNLSWLASHDTYTSVLGGENRAYDIGAASGFSGLVTRPTRFLAGEGGRPERVSVIPMGEPGYEGSAGPQIFITANVQAWDRRDVAAYVEEELGPQIQRFLQKQGRRGSWVTDQAGIRNIATV